MRVRCAPFRSLNAHRILSFHLLCLCPWLCCARDRDRAVTVRVTAPVTVRVHRGRQVIVDVSCDTTNPNNPLPFCNKSTTFENPSYQLTPAEGTYNFNIYLEGHFSRIFKPYTRVALLYVCPALYKMLTCACFLMRCPISRLFFFPFSSFPPLFFFKARRSASWRSTICRPCCRSRAASCILDLLDSYHFSHISLLDIALQLHAPCDGLIYYVPALIAG